MSIIVHENNFINILRRQVIFKFIMQIMVDEVIPYPKIILKLISLNAQLCPTSNKIISESSNI